jgi:hypothetical protein
MTSPRDVCSSGAVWLRTGVAFTALNLPYWMLGQWFYISRPSFNVELILPVLIAAWSRPVAALALAITWALDLTVSQSRSYHFASPLEFLRSVRFLSEVNLGEYLSVSRLLIGLPFVAAVAFALWCAPRRRAPWMPALTIVTVLSVLDVVNGSSLLSQRGTRLIALNIANSPTTTLAIRAWTERQQPSLAVLPADTSATAIADLLG